MVDQMKANGGFIEFFDTSNKPAKISENEIGLNPFKAKLPQIRERAALNRKQKKTQPKKAQTTKESTRRSKRLQKGKTDLKKILDSDDEHLSSQKGRH